MIIGIYTDKNASFPGEYLALMGQRVENNQVIYQHMQQGIAIAQLDYIGSHREKIDNKFEHLTIVGDVRIDNREHLAHKLDISTSQMKQISSEQFILRAYFKWGEDCVKHLLGDFAFAIYDHDKHALFCARDFIGARPFFYCHQRDFFAFSTDPQVLFAIPQVSEKINEPYLAALMIKPIFFDKEQTVFVNVKQLPQSHFLGVYNEQLTMKRYWDPCDIAIEDPFRDDESAVEALLEVYREAVKCRIGVHSTIGFHVTGGLDSCSVGALALENNKDAIAFAWHARPTEEESKMPEYKRIDSFLDVANCQTRYCPPTVETLTQYLYTDHLKTPTMMLRAELPVQQQAQQDNVTLILSGWGGDEGISYHGTGYSLSLLQARKWCEFYRYAKMLDTSLPKALISVGVLPLWRFYVRNWYKEILSQPLQKDRTLYCNQVFLQKVKPLSQSKVTALAKKRQAQLFENGHLAQRITAWHISGAKYGVEYGFPLLDQRIVEFSLRLPMKYFIRNKTRFLMRLMCNKILPHEIAWNWDKKEPQRTKIMQEVQRKMLEQQYENLIEKIPRAQRAQYLNIEKVLGDLRTNNQILHFLNILDL